jgi:hypothetical protein
VHTAAPAVESRQAKAAAGETIVLDGPT